MDTLFTILSFVFAIGVLVVVHEYGHFWVARTLGVKVLKFSVGFGRPLWTRKFGKDKTELIVASIPLGGYVKMLDENEGDVPEEEKHRAFNRKPLWVRICVVIAGPLFNFIFAVAAYTLVFGMGMDDIKPDIEEVRKESIADAAGIRAGDSIVEIDGMQVRGWSEHRIHLMRKAMSRSIVEMKVVSEAGIEKNVALDLSGIKLNRIRGNVLGDVVGVYPIKRNILPIINDVLDGPARTAGIKAGDRVVSVNGSKTETWAQLVKIIAANPEKELVFIVSRNGIKRSVPLVPDKVMINDRVTGRINVKVLVPKIPRDKIISLDYSLADSAVVAINQTWNMSILTLQMLYKMLTLEVSTKNISGPITIAEYAGKTAKIGVDSFIMFLAVVSISLGVLNLLPIPILDGGHLLFYLIEGVKGSPLSENAMLAGQQIGFFLLAGLMILAFYNDLLRLFG